MGGFGLRLAGLAALVALATIAFFGIAAPAPSAVGAQASMQLVPGLDAVTYGQTVAYVARIENTGTITLKDVTFHNPIPATDAGSAVFQSSSCSGTLSATEFSCLVASRLPIGGSVTITIAWQAPAGGSSPGCPSGPACLVSEAFFTAGEGNPTTHQTGPVVAELLSGNDPSKAATYALSTCTDPSSPTLATDQAVGSGNPLATSVCAPSLPVGDPLHPGLVTGIEERPRTASEPGVTEASDLCMPKPGFGCDDGQPFVFSPLATFTFVIHNASLPAGEKIDKVFHDGVQVSTNRRADPHVVRIKIEAFKGITTVTVRSSQNGSWTFG